MGALRRLFKWILRHVLNTEDLDVTISASCFIVQNLEVCTQAENKNLRPHAADNSPASLASQVNTQALAPLLAPMGIEPRKFYVGSIAFAMPWASPLATGDRLRFATIRVDVRPTPARIATHSRLAAGAD